MPTKTLKPIILSPILPLMSVIGAVIYCAKMVAGNMVRRQPVMLTMRGYSTLSITLPPAGKQALCWQKGALTSKTSGEGEIRKSLVEEGLIDCIVNLPAKLFLNTQIPASLWFMSRNRSNGKYRNRTGEILFIDARNMGHLINRRTRELSEDDIQTIAGTYHNWRNPDGDYEDVKGFCNAASIERVKELDYVLTPGRYVGLAEEEDDFDFDFDFAERFTSLKAEFKAQLEEETILNKRIMENLAKVKIDG